METVSSAPLRGNVQTDWQDVWTGGYQDVAIWTAVLLAGERPGGDPLAARFGVSSKALIPVAGTTMLDRVARTLLAAPEIDRVVILAQDPDALAAADGGRLAANPRVTFARSGPGIAASIADVAGSAAAPWPVLVTTADHALLTPAMLKEFLAGASQCDVAVGVGERKIVEGRYPMTRRTWLKFSDGQFSGANLFALRNAAAVRALSCWQEVEQDRKKAWRLFARFGPKLLLRALTRTIGFADALDRAGARIGIRVRPVVLSAPEAPIDVDKVEDLELVEAILEQQRTSERRPRVALVSVPASAPARIAIYDLDRTVTFRPTYSPFLLHGAWHLAPARLLLAPVAGLAMIAHVLGLFSRDRLKTLMWALLLGRAERDRLAGAIASFTRRTLSANIRPGARTQMARDRAEGALLVLATAAHELYAGPLAAALGFDAVVATRAVAGEDGRVGPGLVGGNVYGESKLAALTDFLSGRAIQRPDVTIAFYSDSASDAPVLEWVDRPVAVNPSRRLSRLASRRGWIVADWGRPSP